jgi:hypothetical protein
MKSKIMNSSKNRVPHLRDGRIVAKVGRVTHPSQLYREGWVIRATREPLLLTQEKL